MFQGLDTDPPPPVSDEVKSKMCYKRQNLCVRVSGEGAKLIAACFIPKFGYNFF